MKDRILEFIRSTQINSPVSTGNLTVFPLKTEPPAGFEYLVLDEALKQGSIRISEVSSQGHVPELIVENESKMRVFLMDGEQLIGAKQNRVLNTSIMVEAASKIKIPVSCVEQGRWDMRNRNMQPGDICFGNCREVKNSSVSQNLKRGRSYDSDQGAVWSAVDEMMNFCQVDSPTSSMNDLFVVKEEEIANYSREIPYVEGATGIAAVVSGRLVGVDMFDSGRTMQKLWTKLVRSYSLDALSRRQVRPVGSRRQESDASSVKELLFGVEQAECDAFPSPGIGSDVRIKSAHSFGAGLVCDGCVIHLCLFRDDRDRPPELWTYVRDVE